LLTEKNGATYLITLDGDDNSANNRMNLFEIPEKDEDFAPPLAPTRMIYLGPKANNVQANHLMALVAEKPKWLLVAGMEFATALETSYRWGKGLYISDENHVNVYASDRNVLPYSKCSGDAYQNKDFSIITLINRERQSKEIYLIFFQRNLISPTS
jgi:hypothetical protein